MNQNTEQGTGKDARPDVACSAELDRDPDGARLDLHCAISIGRGPGDHMAEAAAGHLESALRRIVREEVARHVAPHPLAVDIKRAHTDENERLRATLVELLPVAESMMEGAEPLLHGPHIDRCPICAPVLRARAILGAGAA